MKTTKNLIAVLAGVALFTIASSAKAQVKGGERLLQLSGRSFTAKAASSDSKPSPGSSTNARVKPYPLDYCLVSGDKIGEMGKPVVTTYQGQEIKFCCKDCVEPFKKDPAKYIKKLEEAAKKQKETK